MSKLRSARVTQNYEAGRYAFALNALLVSTNQHEDLDARQLLRFVYTTSSSFNNDRTLLDSLSLMRCSRPNHLVSYVGLRKESERMQLNARPVHLLCAICCHALEWGYTAIPVCMMRCILTKNRGSSTSGSDRREEK